MVSVEMGVALIWTTKSMVKSKSLCPREGKLAIDSSKEVYKTMAHSSNWSKQRQRAGWLCQLMRHTSMSHHSTPVLSRRMRAMDIRTWGSKDMLMLDMV